MLVAHLAAKGVCVCALFGCHTAREPAKSNRRSFLWRMAIVLGMHDQFATITLAATVLAMPPASHHTSYSPTGVTHSPSFVTRARPRGVSLKLRSVDSCAGSSSTRAKSCTERSGGNCSVQHQYKCLRSWCSGLLLIGYVLLMLNGVTTSTILCCTALT